MCGITGIYHFSKFRNVDAQALKRMTDIIHHRGPDGSGYYINDNIGLGHRRLSIIDLNTGDQPMSNDDESIVIVYNGEIYNYIELRNELKLLGHSFRTRSDTEVIIRAYEQWGVACNNKFNGMWAFAIWDKNSKNLFLSRDRIGEKPLYYAFWDDSIVFASEIKSILTSGVTAQPNLEVFELYLTLGYLPSPYSFYKNIYKLNPGHYITVTADKWKEVKYWDLPEISEGSMLSNNKEIYEMFEALLRDSVKIRMRSDVPLGGFLSGGLDSSSIVSIMAEIDSKPVNTFTIGFEDRAFDERLLARKIANRFSTNHHELVVTPDSFDSSLNKVLYSYDEPFGDSSAIPTGYISQLAREKVKMVLTGDGGDEVLSGYTSYPAIEFTHLYNRLPEIIRLFLIESCSVASKPFKGNFYYMLKKYENACRTADLCFEKRMLKKFCWTDLDTIMAILPDSDGHISIEDFFYDFMSKCTYKNDFYKLMYYNFKLSLPEDMLVKVDRMSMGYSLEARIPFLDHRLVEYMIRVDKDVKLQNYERKSVLKKTIGKNLPTSILRAPKRGFGVPLREWFKQSEFEKPLEDLYMQDFGLNQKVIKRVVDENRSGIKDNGNFIWMLFLLKNWVLKH